MHCLLQTERLATISKSECSLPKHTAQAVLEHAGQLAVPVWDVLRLLPGGQGIDAVAEGQQRPVDVRALLEQQPLVLGSERRPRGCRGEMGGGEEAHLVGWR